MTQAVVSSSMVKFATLLSEDAVTLLYETARLEGRQAQAILEDALREYVDMRQRNRARQHVVAALNASIADFNTLYDKLSK